MASTNHCYDTLTVSTPAQTCTTGTLNWWPYGGTWYNWPPVSASQEAEKLIAVYKREFGKDWKRMYEKTVRLELK